MKNRTTIQTTKDFIKVLKSRKIIPQEPYQKMMERTFKQNDSVLKENKELKKKLKEMMKLK